MQPADQLLQKKQQQLADGLTDIWLEEIQLLLALLQLLLQLGKLNSNHFQVALVISLQLVHNEGHVVDLAQINAFSISPINNKRQ